MMLTFKGTDKEMKCRGGFQYEIGKTYTDDGAIRCGDKGFHSCEVPMDVWSYFAPTDRRRFFSCEADGEIDRSNEDSKIASSELTLKAEIGILGIIKAQIEYIKKLAKGNIALGDSGHAAAQGYRGHAAAQGYRGHAEVHGEHSIAASFGIDGTAMAEKVGSWLTVYEWEEIDGEWDIKDGKCALVDGKKVKPNVRYKLKNGEFVEVEE